MNLDFVSWDIETSNLNADFSVLLSSVIKPFGGDPIVHRIDQISESWVEGKRKDDRGIVRCVANELEKHSIIVTHYGTGFDLPFLKAKMVRYNMKLHRPLYMMDTYWIAKANLKVSRRRLETLAEYFFGEHKSKVDGELWMEAAMDGNTKAMDMIVKHNIQDCVLLEKLAAVLFPFVKSMRRQ